MDCSLGKLALGALSLQSHDGSANNFIALFPPIVYPDFQSFELTIIRIFLVV